MIYVYIYIYTHVDIKYVKVRTYVLNYIATQLNVLIQYTYHQLGHTVMRDVAKKNSSLVYPLMSCMQFDWCFLYDN